ncbi:MAG TPA: DUF3105 domain-containing protein [Mycobacteriales bacterium]|nr:DUF3105 domain-containing protein [Mycobacteriales bacterium]
MSRRTAWSLSLCVALAACSGGGSGSATPTPTPSATPDIPGVVLTQGLAHTHVAHRVDYPTHPPVGGPHWPPSAFGALGWQACAVYTVPVVDEFAVHSLEHGAVWITYLPTVPDSVVAQLRLLAGIRPAYVLVSPYPGQGSPVMVTAWGAQLGVTSATDDRLADFVRTYAGGGQGGELGGDCAHGSTVEQAEAALARAATGT